MTKSRKAVAKLGVKRRYDERAPAPIKKWPAAEAKVAAKATGPPATRPAASAPLGKFNLSAWIAENVQSNEAKDAPIRRNGQKLPRNLACRMPAFWKCGSMSGVRLARCMTRCTPAESAPSEATVYDSAHPCWISPPPKRINSKESAGSNGKISNPCEGTVNY